MADIVTPALGESVSEATVARWTKKPGDRVKKDEVLVELETDKVGLEVAAPSDGVLAQILAPEGATVTPGAKLGLVTEAGAGTTVSVAPTFTAMATPPETVPMLSSVEEPAPLPPNRTPVLTPWTRPSLSIWLARLRRSIATLPERTIPATPGLE